MPEEGGEGNEQKLPERSGFIGVGGTRAH